MSAWQSPAEPIILINEWQLLRQPEPPVSTSGMPVTFTASRCCGQQVRETDRFEAAGQPSQNQKLASSRAQKPPRCDREGALTFADLLKVLMEDKPDEAVPREGMLSCLVGDAVPVQRVSELDHAQKTSSQCSPQVAG